MTDKQPEALRLARIWDCYDRQFYYGQTSIDTSVELRRLHALCDEMASVVKSVASTPLHTLPAEKDCRCSQCSLAKEARVIYDKVEGVKMSAHENGGPAFPQTMVFTDSGGGIVTSDEMHVGGMTLRDHFAGLAMQGMLAGHFSYHGHSEYWSPEGVASEAYARADAMLKGRNK